MFLPLINIYLCISMAYEKKQQYLLGLMQLILNVPQSIVIENMKDVLPVTIMSLSSNNDVVKMAALRTFLILVGTLSFRNTITLLLSLSLSLSPLFKTLSTLA